MSADFEISLPNWPFNRLLAEACGAYNLHRPEGAQEADPSHSEWPLLCGVVHSYIRHNLTEYDSVLSVAGGDEALREELHKKINAAAHRAYPWLRVERDPRGDVQEEKPEDYRPFNDFSRRLSDLVSERSRLTVAIKDARRKRLGREHVAELEEQLARVNARAERLNEFFKPAVRKKRPHWCTAYAWRIECADTISLGASWLSATQSAGFKCPACSKTVMRSKIPMPVGAGKKQVAFSCHCASLLMEPAYAARVRLSTWQEMLSGRPESQDTDIIVLDDDGILYGHPSGQGYSRRPQRREGCNDLPRRGYSSFHCDLGNARCR